MKLYMEIIIFSPILQKGELIWYTMHAHGNQTYCPVLKHGRSIYNVCSEAHDCAWILQEIKGVTHKFEGTQYISMSLHDARKHFYMIIWGITGL